MAWTAEKVKAMRESNPAKAAESDGWTAEKVRAMRTKTPTASAATVETTPRGNVPTEPCGKVGRTSHQ